MGCTNSKEKEDDGKAPPVSDGKQTTESVDVSAGKSAKNITPTAAEKSNATDSPAGRSNPGTGGATTSPANNNNQNNTAHPVVPPPPAKADYKSLRQVVMDAEQVLTSMTISDEEKRLVALSFVNTLSDVLRQSYRLKREAVSEAIDDLCSDPAIVIHRSVIPQATHGAREEFLLHLITSWISRNPTGEPTLPSEIANEILSENQITPWKHVPMRFGDCYRELLRIGDNAFTNEVFSKYAEGNLTINAQQFLRFLVDCQRSDTASMKIADEKTKERFGAVGTRFTFALYLQSLTLNTAQEPRRGGTVWQDMTQPLPRYMVRTSLVDTEEELQCSLAMGVRSIVVHCHQGVSTDQSPDNDATVADDGTPAAGADGPVMAGDTTLDALLHIIKEEGFTASNYPLMLCLAPEVTLTLPLQEKIAKSLITILGDEMLAKGMMFDGATVKDPKFSPAALQHRVLVIGSQAPLKPFIGFLVADMNRNGLGVKVTNVVAHTPAAKAGVQKGDWFTHINDEPITSKSHLKSILAKLQLGEEFTMRRENLDDVTIVVGGTVEGDTQNAKDLSNLVFLKFAPKADKEGHLENSPWDICVADHSAKLNQNDHNNHSSGDDTAAHDAKERTKYNAREGPSVLEIEEAASREELNSHFSFTTLSHPPHTAVSTATHSGVQLICATRHVDDQKWSRGFYTDNGECGYIQKSEVIEKSARRFRLQLRCPPPHFHNWTMAGLKGTMFGEGVLEVDEEAMTLDIRETDDLSVCTFLLTLMPPTHVSGGSSLGLSFRGNDSVAATSTDSNAVRYASALPTSPVRAQADAIAKPVVLSVSFSVAIMRLGIRAFASVEEKDEGKWRCMPHYPILAEISSAVAE